MKVDDFARAVNNGVVQLGRQPGTVEMVVPGSRIAVIVNKLGELVMLLPLRESCRKITEPLFSFFMSEFTQLLNFCHDNAYMSELDHMTVIVMGELE